MSTGHVAPRCTITPSSWHFVPLNAEIPSSAPYYRTLSAFMIFLPLTWEAKFHTHTKTGKIIDLYMFFFCTANGRTGDSGPNARRHSPNSSSSSANHTSKYFWGSLLHSIYTVSANLPSGKAVKNSLIHNTGVPPHPRVIRSKARRGYVKPRIIPNAIYNGIFVKQT
jgi:hypothetical protein